MGNAAGLAATTNVQERVVIKGVSKGVIDKNDVLKFTVSPALKNTYPKGGSSFAYFTVLGTGQTGQAVTAPAAPACFPGEATAALASGRTVPVAELREGDNVLIERTPGVLSFAPVLGFLHATRAHSHHGDHFLIIQHQVGKFRASRNHLVFVVDAKGVRTDAAVGELQTGDRILAHDISSPGRSKLIYSTVVSVFAGSTAKGMFAPFTASGTVVVDGSVASVYGLPFLKNGALPVRLGHATIHAVFFAFRACHILGLGSLLFGRGQSQSEWIHPFVQVLLDYFRGLEIIEYLQSAVAL